jgi:hypothetical protein
VVCVGDGLEDEAALRVHLLRHQPRRDLMHAHATTSVLMGQRRPTRASRRPALSVRPATNDLDGFFTIMLGQWVSRNKTDTPDSTVVWRW